jgi:hypothetical protein
MARGLMSIPRIERTPSDSSFKRVKPKSDTGFAKTLRSPRNPELAPPRARRTSSSSDDIKIAHKSNNNKGRFLSKLRRGSNTEQSAKPVFVSSRFGDSSDEEDVVLARPSPAARRLDSSMTAPVILSGSGFTNVGGGTSGVGVGGYTESLPASPTVKKRSSFSQLFKRHGRRDSKVSSISEMPLEDTTSAMATDAQSGHQRSKSASIFSKRTGKEKRFQGLRKLFRIKE